jgi:two-component system, LytTR family, response regulator
MDKTNIRAVIIDDEMDGRNIIALLLQQFFPNIFLEGQAENVTQGINLVKMQEPDLIFLDVEMPDGNAFDLLASCGNLKSHVILVTAHEHYSLKAIKASVMDYLLKPVNKNEFVIAVNKALTKTIQENNSDQSVSLSNLYKHLMIKKLRIPTLTGFSLVNIEDIVRCEASGNYTLIFFADKKTITASRTLGEYEDELKTYGFVRIHHKHLINVMYILEYNKGKSGGGYVTLQGREVLEVSIRKKADLLNALH